MITNDTKELFKKLASRKLGAFLVVCVAIAAVLYKIPIELIVDKIDRLMAILAVLSGYYIHVQGSIDKSK